MTENSIDFATSEIGFLKKILIHCPGQEWDLIPCLPGSLKHYLIEDILVLPKAQKEHRIFTNILALFIGKENVLEFKDLLTEVCTDQNNNKEIVAAIAALESLGQKTIQNLLKLSPADLAKTLICGSIIKQDSPKDSYENLFDPIPNLLFTRDIGVAIPNGFIICHAAKKARQRETLLMRYVLRHKTFTHLRIIDIRNKSNDIFWGRFAGNTKCHIEGGDVLVINENTLMIGTGERTTEFGFYTLLKTLREEGVSIKNIIRAIIPKQRGSMHLDTLLTMTNKDEFIAHEDIVQNIEFHIYKYPYKNEAKKPLKFLEALSQAAQINSPKIVKCGGENPLFQSREQWTDGANLLAIAPKILLGYSKNEETIKTLQKSGYTYLEAQRDLAKIEDLAKQCKNNNYDPVIIGLPGSELSRARGGPRCMSMPLIREGLSETKIN